MSKHDQQGQWNRTANKMVQRFKETGHHIFRSTSALSRGILMRERGRSTIHFNGDTVNTEFLFQKVHSVNLISDYAAATDWCCQLGSTKEEEQVPTPVNNGIYTMVQPEEVATLVSVAILAQAISRSNVPYGFSRSRAFSGFVLSKCLQPSFVVSQLFSWHV